jgi:hypothetical protein
LLIVDVAAMLGIRNAKGCRHINNRTSCNREINEVRRALTLFAQFMSFCVIFFFPPCAVLPSSLTFVSPVGTEASAMRMAPAAHRPVFFNLFGQCRSLARNLLAENVLPA